MAIAAALLGERFGATDVIGSVIVAAGILMVQLSRVPATAGPAQAAGVDIRSIHSASSAAARVPAVVMAVLVALGVLGVLLLGRRAVTAWLVRRTRR